MTRQRTPPISQPLGWEKTDKCCEISCTESERLLWRATYGIGKVSDGVRAAVNQDVYRQAGIPVEAVVPPLRMTFALRAELRRHQRRLRELSKQSRPRTKARSPG
jgi:hypothetical protein